MVTGVALNILITNNGLPVELMVLIYLTMMVTRGNGFQKKVLMFAGKRRRGKVFFLPEGKGILGNYLISIKFILQSHPIQF
jgi:hypothetical protein